MATRLYRLGGWAYEHRKRVLVGWLLVLVAVFASAAAFSGKTSNEFAVPGTESQVAQDLLEEKFPGAGGGSARVVFAAPAGEKLTDPENKAAVMESVENASNAPEVSAVQDPYSMGAISKDGRIGFADVYYPVKAEEVEKSSADALEASTEPATKAGMQVEFGGGVVTEEGESKAEMVGLLVGFLVLAMTLGSLLAAGLPLLTAIIGVGLGTSASPRFPARSRSRRPLRSSPRCSGSRSASTTRCSSCRGTARTSTTAWSRASRRRRRPRRPEARWCSPALTVVIALVGLVVVNIPFLTVMGLAAAVTVVARGADRRHAAPRAPRVLGQAAGRRNRFLVKRPRRRAEGAPTAQPPLRPR